MEEHKLSRSSKKNLSGVKKQMKELVERSLKKSEHDFGVPQYGGLRTAQEQNNLFYKIPKVTSLDGFKRKSYHQSGWAFDIFALNEDGRACWDDCKEKYLSISKVIKAEFEIMKEEGIFKANQILNWGGDWGGHWKSHPDLPHFEVKTV